MSLSAAALALLATATSTAAHRPAEGKLDFRLRTGAPGQRVELMTSINDWENAPITMRETEAGIFTASIPTPWTPVLLYKFRVDGRWQEDPENPSTSDDGYGGKNSVLETGFQEDSWLQTAAPLLPETRFDLRDPTGQPRTITLVAPETSGCVAIYFLDGQDYLQFARVRNLLANLREYSSLPCFAGVFIPPRDREGEDVPGPKNTEFAQWIARSVVPAAETRTHSGGSVSRRLILGPSLAGLGAALISLLEPTTFRLAASQSGSFWWNDREFFRVLENSRPVQLLGYRLVMHVGDLEATSLLSANRVLRDWLASRSLVAAYAEHPSQHDWIAWRNELRQILTQAFSPSPSP